MTPFDALCWTTVVLMTAFGLLVLVGLAALTLNHIIMPLLDKNWWKR